MAITIFMKIKILYSDNNFILIALHNLDSIRKWHTHCNKLVSKYSYRMNNPLSAIETGKIKGNETLALNTSDKDKIQKVYTILLDSLKKLSDKDMNVNFKVPNQFTFDQTVLNNLHRYYTDNAKKFKQDTRIFELISNINYCCHELEDFTTMRRQGYVSDLWFHISKYPIQMDCWMSFTDSEIKENYNFLDYDYQYPVRLDRSILGKCVLQAYEEDDNPLADDCTGRLGSFGGFFVDTDQKLKKIYQSELFRNWCSTHRVTPDKLPLEFLIGQVQEHSDDMTAYIHKNFEGIEFIS